MGMLEAAATIIKLELGSWDVTNPALIPETNALQDVGDAASVSAGVANNRSANGARNADRPSQTR